MPMITVQWSELHEFMAEIVVSEKDAAEARKGLTKPELARLLKKYKAVPSFEGSGIEEILDVDVSK